MGPFRDTSRQSLKACSYKNSSYGCFSIYGENTPQVVARLFVTSGLQLALTRVWRDLGPNTSYENVLYPQIYGFG